ncbi:MAG: hypothetical protein IPJ41_14700 [Phycisphaerales bacterium]|nr:hypothetical protein [Phycisphaerales bacterium]
MREHEARQLLDLVQKEFPETSTAPPAIWDGDPPLKIIDCVLSLNRHYERVVVPRVAAFAAKYPDIKTCGSLRDAMLAATPEACLRTHLDTRDPRRAATLLGVVEFAIDAAQAFPAESEEASLRAWAADARPGDYLAVGVRGFGLAGFQYLRMLFGANTAKPDRHIIDYVSRATGGEPSDVEALYAMERAAQLGGFSAAWLDHEIWKRATHN